MTRALRLLIPLAFIPTLAAPATQHTSHPQEGMPADAPYWEGLMDSMTRMHAAMSSTGPSADPDTDFVALMLPHHQAAIDMAREDGSHLETLVPHAEVSTYPNVGHMPFWEATERFNRELREFCDRI